MRLLPLGLIGSIATMYGINFHDFDIYQNTLSREEIETKIEKYLEKDPQVAEFYLLTSDALIIGDLEQGKTDYILHLTDYAYPVLKSKNLFSLQGAKIALDPGHFGGAFAKLENRYIEIPAEETGTGDRIAFDEGTLAYLTALELKSLLQAEGAEVFITRPGLGQGVIEETFFEWLQKHPALAESREPLTSLFRTYYNREDLFARAEKINAFAPDVALMIHYNVESTAAHLTDVNYCLGFIPGAFCAGELNRVEDRYEFLRLLVTDELQESLKLSQKIVEQLSKQLNIPLMDQESYLEKVCLMQEPGIYSRNLALTRLISSPLCYGESLIQNNTQEAFRLATNDIEIGGIPCSSRIREVARAYFEGIKSYFADCKIGKASP